LRLPARPVGLAQSHVLWAPPGRDALKFLVYKIVLQDRGLGPLTCAYAAFHSHIGEWQRQHNKGVLHWLKSPHTSHNCRPQSPLHHRLHATLPHRSPPSPPNCRPHAQPPQSPWLLAAGPVQTPSCPDGVACPFSPIIPPSTPGYNHLKPPTSFPTALQLCHHHSHRLGTTKRCEKGSATQRKIMSLSGVRLPRPVNTTSGLHRLVCRNCRRGGSRPPRIQHRASGWHASPAGLVPEGGGVVGGGGPNGGASVKLFCSDDEHSVGDERLSFKGEENSEWSEAVPSLASLSSRNALSDGGGDACADVHFVGEQGTEIRGVEVVVVEDVLRTESSSSRAMLMMWWW